MDELTEDVGSTGNMNRREALRRGAFVVGAATLWTTPVVQTLGMRPASAQTSPDVAEFCPENSGTITSLILRYTGMGCGHFEGPTLADEGCTGSGGMDLIDTAFVVIRVGSTGNNAVTFSGEVTAYDDLIDTGIPRSPQSSTWMDVYDAEGGTLLASQRFHTSCSQELRLGEEYGPAEIYDGDWVPN